MASPSRPVSYILRSAFLTHANGILVYQLVARMSVPSVELSMLPDQMPTIVVVVTDAFDVYLLDLLSTMSRLGSSSNILVFSPFNLPPPRPFPAYGVCVHYFTLHFILHEHQNRGLSHTHSILSLFGRE
jgi:hypothetical protein